MHFRQLRTEPNIQQQNTHGPVTNTRFSDTTPPHGSDFSREVARADSRAARPCAHHASASPPHSRVPASHAFVCPSAPPLRATPSRPQGGRQISRPCDGAGASSHCAPSRAWDLPHGTELLHQHEHVRRAARRIQFPMSLTFGPATEQGRGCLTFGPATEQGRRCLTLGPATAHWLRDAHWVSNVGGAGKTTPLLPTTCESSSRSTAARACGSAPSAQAASGSAASSSGDAIATANASSSSALLDNRCDI